MNHTALRTGIAAGVAAAGLTVGGIALASAEDDGGDGTDSATTSQSERRPGPHHRGGPGGPGGQARAAALAEALGVSEEDVETAFETLRDELRPGPDAEAPDPEEMRDAFVAALAAALDLAEDDVAAAFEDIAEEHRAEHRDALAERLDEAVADGKLTEADKESVLKAYDAGVLRGGPLR